MRCFQLSFVLCLIAIVCAVPLGQHKDQRGKKLQRRNFALQQGKYTAAYFLLRGLANMSMAGSHGLVCRLGKLYNRFNDQRTLAQIEFDETQEAFYGDCTRDGALQL